MISTANIVLRQPKMEDGAKIWKLVKETNVLDVNSSYSYIMMCMFFADTCVVAEDQETGKIVGFITAYRPPSDPESIFVWQIGVDVSQRGKGLGGALLESLLRRKAVSGVKYVTATISPSNIASQKLFEKLASTLRSEVHKSEEQSIPQHVFPEGGHEAELMYRIGPVTLPLPESMSS